MNGMRPSRSSRQVLAKPHRLLFSLTKILRSDLGGEAGQMSIFLALMFQVLFVFFAMVINIGLLVHDKINLQNSVDLGAYYAAQKQAEILNEIAHLNYQIRQDYKLLAWRYWVLGTLGRDGGGRSQPPPATTVTGTPPDGPRRYRVPGAPQADEEVPVACLANPFWWEFAKLSGGNGPNENYCWHSYTWTSSAISSPPPILSTPATIFINLFANSLTQRSIQNYNKSCEAASPFSWAFVAAILTDYKHSIAYKKKAIKKLRENLVSDNPLDRDGKSIREGVIQTIKKNLTESNLQSFNPNNVQMLNGLTKGGCNTGATAGEKTLPEILTAPGLYFSLLRTIPGNRCQFSAKFQNEIGNIPGGVANWDPTGEMQFHVRGEPLPDSEFHSSLGFEKNPWCMAYMGVKAATSPRKPFAPFGNAVNLAARAFAQPFGGRVGPWYSKRWVRGEPTSVAIPQPLPSGAGGNASGAAVAELNPASGQQERVDPLTSPRLNPTQGSFQYSSYTIPNFSRYPGDVYGLRSSLNQSMARKFFGQTTRFLGTVASSAFTDYRVRILWFYGFTTAMNFGDTLAFDNPTMNSYGGLPPQLLEYRQLETAAVAPDLFDITYYSIDPEADKNYAPYAGRYGIQGAHFGDLGSRENIAELKKYNVEEQIKSSNGIGFDGNLVNTAGYWIVRDWKHLLTSWAPHRATNFGFPTDRFGKCDGADFDTTPIPGKCVAGGRVGYSVRLISREHLNGMWSVGGEGEPAGPLLNPPGDDIEF